MLGASGKKLTAAEWQAKALRAQAEVERLKAEIAHLRGAVPAFESPLEDAFWRRWQELHRDIRLESQHSVLGGKYRIDFAHLASKTAIELDGITYHSDADKFKGDRERDRNLTRNGWRVIRFAGSEIREDCDRCIREVIGFIQKTPNAADNDVGQKQYRVRVESVDLTETRYGEQLEIKFAVHTSNGPRTGQVILGVCSPKWHRMSRLGEWALVLLGNSAPAFHEPFDADLLVGCVADISVEGSKIVAMDSKHGSWKLADRRF